jgi:2'-5' RNA ligase
MRTFVSIEISEEIKERIEALVSRMKLMLTPIRWVEKKNLHVTLKFTGWMADEKLPELEKCVTDSIKGSAPFTLSFAGIGAFPTLKRPRVIWVGTKDGADASRQIADKIENKMGEKGLREEEKEFTPHLTIGHIKEKIDVASLSKFVEEHGETDFGSMEVDHVSIMKSTLRRTGPIYEEIKRIKL